MLGVCLQAVVRVEVATPKRLSKRASRRNVAGVEIVYRRIPEELFFGYRRMESRFAEGFYFLIAEPEKALLDMVFRGEDTLKLFTLDYEAIDPDKLVEYSTHYPRHVRAWASAVSNAILSGRTEIFE